MIPEGNTPRLRFEELKWKYLSKNVCSKIDFFLACKMKIDFNSNTLQVYFAIMS